MWLNDAKTVEEEHLTADVVLRLQFALWKLSKGLASKSFFNYVYQQVRGAPPVEHGEVGSGALWLISLG